MEFLYPCWHALFSRIYLIFSYTEAPEVQSSRILWELSYIDLTESPTVGDELHSQPLCPSKDFESYTPRVKDNFTILHEHVFSYNEIKNVKPGMMKHACNLTTQEA